MKNLLHLTCLLSSLSSFAQISISASDFPEGGDTAQVSISTDFEFDFSATGPDYTWDFSALSMSEQRIDTFFDIEDASITYQIIFNNGWLDPDYQADYFTPFLDFVVPESELFELPISNPVGFTKIESDKVEAVGIGVEIGGIQVPVKNEIIDIEYELPMNYEDEWISNSYFEIDLNPAFDGILRRYQERNTQVDGWGEIITPFGTFEVLRTFATIDFTDSLKVTFGETESWFELPTPTQIVYSWWAEDQKIPVLEVVVQDVFGEETVSSVEYRDRWLGDLSITDFEQLDFTIYPNPTSNFIRISGVNQIDAVSIVNPIGQVIENWTWASQNQVIDVSNLSTGTYFIQITVGDVLQTRQFIIE